MWQLMIMVETALLTGPPSPSDLLNEWQATLGPLCHDQCCLRCDVMQQIMWHVGWVSPGSSWALRPIGPDFQQVSPSHRCPLCLWVTFLHPRVWEQTAARAKRIQIGEKSLWFVPVDVVDQFKIQYVPDRDSDSDVHFMSLRTTKKAVIKYWLFAWVRNCYSEEHSSFTVGSVQVRPSLPLSDALFPGKSSKSFLDDAAFSKK